MEVSFTPHDEWNQAGDTASLAEHQTALYALLKEFDRVAKILKTPYFLFAGTLLGAVRHKGFIPWDDDLDVLMMREDYERYLAEAPALIDPKFFLQGEFTAHWPMFFSKLRINGTACLEKYHPKDLEAHQGVYIDIFPCDRAYSLGVGRMIQFAASKVVIAKGLDARGYSNDGGLKKPFMRVCRLLPMKPFHDIVKGPKKKTAYVHSFLGGASKYARNIYKAAWFDGSVDLSFEDGAYPAPGGYHELLSAVYGEYMKIPSEEERGIKKHCVLVDLKRDYRTYDHYRGEVKWDVHIRSIR